MCYRCANSIVVRSQTPNKMTGVHQRRRFRRCAISESSQIIDDMVEGSGTAYLCFPNNRSWFKGSVTTEDNSNYSLYGERISSENSYPEMAESMDDTKLNVTIDENNNVGTEEKTRDYYRVTLLDHFIGKTTVAPRVYIANCKASESQQLFATKDGEISFKVDQFFRGQKAELEMKKVFGSTAKFGNGSAVYTGNIKIQFQEHKTIGSQSFCF